MHKLFVIGVLGALANGCMYVSADIGELQKTIDDDSLNFQLMPGMAGVAVEDTRSLHADIHSNLLQLVTQAQVTKMSFHLKSGMSSFDFINSAKIVLKPDNSDLPSVTLATFDKSTDGAAGEVLSVDVNQDFDHTQYLKENTPFDLTVDMVTPSVDWSMNIELHLMASAGQKFSL